LARRISSAGPPPSSKRSRTRSATRSSLEHVDELERDAAIAVAIAHGADVVHGRGLALPVARELRAAGDVDEQILGEEAEGGVPVAALGGGEIAVMSSRGS
jgi:hypothetical protein